MKPIVFLLFICFLLPGCSKEDPEAERRAAEIAAALKVLPGGWQFNRMATDPEFKNLVEVINQDCIPGSYIRFDSEGGFTDVLPYDEKDPEKSGKYTVDFRTDLSANRGGLGPILHLVRLSPLSSVFHIIPDHGYPAVILDSFSKDRLVFYVSYLRDNKSIYVYVELLRKW